MLTRHDECLYVLPCTSGWRRPLEEKATQGRQHLCGPFSCERLQRPRNEWPQVVVYMQMLHGGKEGKKFEPLCGVDAIPLPCMARWMLADGEQFHMREERR